MHFVYAGQELLAQFPTRSLNRDIGVLTYLDFLVKSAEFNKT